MTFDLKFPSSSFRCRHNWRLDFMMNLGVLCRSSSQPCSFCSCFKFQSRSKSNGSLKALGVKSQNTKYKYLYTYWELVGIRRDNVPNRQTALSPFLVIKSALCCSQALSTAGTCRACLMLWNKVLLINFNFRIFAKSIIWNILDSNHIQMVFKLCWIENFTD